VLVSGSDARLTCATSSLKSLRGASNRIVRIIDCCSQYEPCSR
jgi:hypothetical protein